MYAQKLKKNSIFNFKEEREQVQIKEVEFWEKADSS
jgi:hypothetical protein